VLLFRSIFVFLVSFGVIFFALSADYSQRSKSELTRQWQSVTVSPPDSKPSYSQNSVDVAMAMFGIQMPENTAAPKFDPNLFDRGLTVRRGWNGKAKVTIGPPAFQSWSLLGSTLAHELEIHCNQSFFLISMLDTLGLDGTAIAERQAYQHELLHANRFGLTKLDQQLIQDTLEFYYPERRAPYSDLVIASQMTRSLQRMLAAPLRAQRLPH